MGIIATKLKVLPINKRFLFKLNALTKNWMNGQKLDVFDRKLNTLNKIATWYEISSNFIFFYTRIKTVEIFSKGTHYDQTQAKSCIRN